ncbi:MAG: helix-turn-helix transcriptional regulator [Lachnospiraceae bacterium]|nr:helix-turn-helix transcriptional regulator [Lachnospiraceae bacterium]
MVEFGEQLRNEREKNGLTQKSLAEQLYVTRQTVSRWECGERYPDIITLKRISGILSVSLDDLLSGKEMTKMVEKTPVVENKTINNITSVLYAFIVLSVFMQLAVEIALLYIQAYDRFELVPFDITNNLVNLERIIYIMIFIYGIYHAVKDTLTPKKIGIILFTFFTAHLILYGGVRLYWDIPNYVQAVKAASDPNLKKFGEGSGIFGIHYMSIIQSVFSNLWSFVIPCVLGAIASLRFFILGGKRKLWVNLLTIATVLRIIDTVCLFIGRFQEERFYTINNSLATYEGAIANTNGYIADFVLGIALSVLVIYQAYTLYRKRRTAMDISGN